MKTLQSSKFAIFLEYKNSHAQYESFYCFPYCAIYLAAKRENKKLSTSIWVFEFQKVGHFMMHKPPISVELYLIQYMGWKNIAKKYYTIVVVMESGNQISVFG